MTHTNTHLHTTAALSILAWTGSVLAATIHVPGDYTTIQDAVDAAAAGDEVVLAAGIYTDSFTFKEDHVLVRSADGPAATTLDGSDSWVYFPPFSSGELRGLTIRNHEHSYNGAVTIRRCVATVTDCIFEDNRNYFAGAALRIDAVSLGDVFEVEVRGCTFRRNVSSDWGGAMSASLWEDDNLTIADCLFEDNTSGDGGHLVLAPNGPDGHISVEQCTFRRGSGDQIGGLRIVNQGIGAEGFAEVALLDCLFEDHEQDGVSVSGEVSLTIDGGSFMNSGMPTVNLITPATAEVSNSQFCGSAVHIAGTWTDLGGNSFSFTCPCPGDGIPDGTVDVHDLLGMIAAFGSDDETWDFDGDGLVGVNDMLVLIAAWGPC
jgi:hypothetical protein